MRSPSASAINETSRPSIFSSSTTRSAAAPTVRRSISVSMHSSVSSASRATSVPLPLARPSALTTKARRSPRTKSFALAGLSKTRWAGVGTPARSISDLANALRLSMRPAAWVGPKTSRPAAVRRSANPAATATSGPMTVRPTSRSITNRAIPSTSVACSPVLMAIAPVAALPGAQNTVSVSGLCSAFQVSACSRPPPPTMRTFIDLFPFDSRRRLRRDVVHHAIHAGNLVDDATRDLRQDVVRQPRPVGGHAVLALHSSHRHHVAVGAVVTHHAHALQRGQDREGLPERAIEPGGFDLVDDDPVGRPQRFQPVARDLADDADGEPRTREGLPLHHVIGKPQRRADRADFVLEEVSKRLDQLEAKVRSGERRVGE